MPYEQLVPYTAPWYEVVVPPAVERFMEAYEAGDPILDTIIEWPTLFNVFLLVGIPPEDTIEYYQWVRDWRGEACAALNRGFYQAGYPFILKPEPNWGVYFFVEGTAVNMLELTRLKKEQSTCINSIKQYTALKEVLVSDDHLFRLEQAIAGSEATLYFIYGRVMASLEISDEIKAILAANMKRFQKRKQRLLAESQK